MPREQKRIDLLLTDAGTGAATCVLSEVRPERGRLVGLVLSLAHCVPDSPLCGASLLNAGFVWQVDECWVDVRDNLKWLAGGKRFTVRASARGRLSGLTVLHRGSAFYGALCVGAQGAERPKTAVAGPGSGSRSAAAGRTSTWCRGTARRSST